MTYFILKAVISGLVIAGVTTLSDKTPVGGALLKSLPITSYLVFIIMYYEGRSSEQLIGMSKDIFILVIPSLVLFLAFPFFLSKNMSFYPSLGIATVLMVVCYVITLKFFLPQ
jgi:hypothetical protein